MGNRLTELARGLALLIGVVALPQPAHAVILNLGVDIKSDGSYVVTSFYNGSNDGDVLHGGRQRTGLVIPPFINIPPIFIPGESLTLTLNTAAVFGGYQINSASLFVDALDIANDDVPHIFVQGTQLADLSNNSGSGTRIPVQGGPVGTTAPRLDPGDVDNSFYTLTGSLKDTLATSTNYTVKFANADVRTAQLFLPASNDFRVDGINIQVDAQELPPPPPPQEPVVPEPATLLLVGLSGLGAAVSGVRTRKATRV